MIRKRVSPGAALLAAALAARSAAAAPGVERWTAVSTTAMAITGDIMLSPHRLVAARHSFPLSVAADVPNFATGAGPAPARVLEVTASMNPVLLNGNRLCSSPVRWIVAYRGEGGRQLNLAVFGGDAMPVAEADPGLCGTFLYAR